ncbi:transcriptional repressor [bacterium]|nr:transcriptional repressor [bacterium]
MNQDSIANRLRDELRGAGLRATASRVAVLRLLRGAGQPLSHGEVVRALADGPWDRSSLYRNLIDLERVGLARRTQLGAPVWRFEDASSDHAVSSHPHFVCAECGKVACLPELTVTAPEAPGFTHAAAEGKVEVQLRSRCDACREDA